jgi:hypothetical protein
LKYGYKISIEYSYIFERGKDLFKDYVNDHYEIKKKTNDPVERTITKLFLNSLYGRLGMNEIEEKMEIVEKEIIENLDKYKNVSIISELDNNKYLVKYNSDIGENIRLLYSNDSSLFDLKILGLNKTKTISSAVHIAAAISSYARLLIN